MLFAFSLMIKVLLLQVFQDASSNSISNLQEGLRESRAKLAKFLLMPQVPVKDYTWGAK